MSHVAVATPLTHAQQSVYYVIALRYMSYCTANVMAHCFFFSLDSPCRNNDAMTTKARLVHNMVMPGTVWLGDNMVMTGNVAGSCQALGTRVSSWQVLSGTRYELVAGRCFPAICSRCCLVTSSRCLVIDREWEAILPEFYPDSRVGVVT